MQLPPANNLPQQLTSFIGREDAVATLKSELAAARLLTIWGPGGAGKTRLSLKVASEMLRRYPDGAWFVELSTLTDAGLVPQAVASVLGVREEQGQPLMQTLVERLKPLRLLLLLDNCEHLIHACAALASELLHNCAGLTILATSRESLNIEGETPWQVPAMTRPEPGRRVSVEKLHGYESIQLFVERARRSRDGFMLTDANGQALVELCWRLDGLPLAIELAAARVRTLSVQQIAEHLDQRFKLLTYNVQDVEPRQRTLKALIDWSYDLLTQPEKEMLRRISVFVGSFTLDAATAVCGGGKDEFEVLDLLTPLAEKSLIMVEEHHGEARYRLIESIREYGLERLKESGEAEELRERHADWYLQMGERAQGWLLGENSKLWMDLLELDHDNIRAALEWATGGGQNAGTALRLAGAVWRFWDTRGYISEGRKWLGDALSVGGEAPPLVRAKALNAAGNLALEQGDFGRAEELYEGAFNLRVQTGDELGTANSLSNLAVVARRKGEFERAAQLNEDALAIQRKVDNKNGIASVLSNLGYVVQQQGHYERAIKLSGEALALFRELGDQQGIIIAFNNLGGAEQARGNYEEAQSYYDEALSGAQALDDKLGMAGVIKSLGSLEKARGNYGRAAEHYRESLDVYYDQGDKQGVAECLEGLATVEAGDYEERSMKLFGAAEVIRERTGSPHPPADRLRFEGDVAEARSGAGDEALDAAWDAGRALSLDVAVTLARQPVEALTKTQESKERPKRKNYGLTRREIDVLRVAIEAESSDEIGRRLSITRRTVDSHLGSIYNKLQVSSRPAAVRLAQEQGLI